MILFMKNDNTCEEQREVYQIKCLTGKYSSDIDANGGVNLGMSYTNLDDNKDFIKK